MKASWKQTPLEQSKDKRNEQLRQAHEEIIQLKKSIEHHKHRILLRDEEISYLHKQYKGVDALQQKYEYLIHQEIMLPTEEGFKHFDNAQEVDKYIEDKLLPHSYASNLARSINSMSSVMNEQLNKMFQAEYEKHRKLIREIRDGHTRSDSQEEHQEDSQ